MALLRHFSLCRIAGVITVLWVIAVLMVATPVFRKSDADPIDVKTQQRLIKAFNELDLLKRQNEKLKELISSINMVDPNLPEKEHGKLHQGLQHKLMLTEDIILGNSKSKNEYPAIEAKDEPSTQYEQLRRKLYDRVEEFWYYVSAELKRMQKQAMEYSSQFAGDIGKVLEQGKEHKRSLLNDAATLEEVDGYRDWREQEANELSDLVQRRLHFLQNPPDCATARKLICRLNKGCGYGCQLHHVVYCFMVAYGTQRTMILKSKGWRYHKAGWEEVFLPVSDTCTDPSGQSHQHWPGKSDTQVIELPIIDSLSPRPPYLPLAVPADLAPRLSRLHGDPIVWWVGQFLKYLLRPTETTSKMIETATNKLGFKTPIVGVHIRRTDKVGTEAAFHPVEEYMAAVDEWYNLLELKEHVGVRRVYLASDDPKVIFDAQKKYPNYEIISDPTVANTAQVATRYTDTSLNGIILDIHFLSMSDYLVCTFSSQVCRVAYELMQTMYPDASARFRSLDDIYYYGGQSPHNRKAIIAHKPKSAQEMELEVGDLVGVAGNHWDGYSKGRNLRTNQVGLYPSFKVVDVVHTEDFPKYTEVPWKRAKT